VGGDVAVVGYGLDLLDPHTAVSARDAKARFLHGDGEEPADAVHERILDRRLILDERRSPRWRAWLRGHGWRRIRTCGSGWDVYIVLIPYIFIICSIHVANPSVWIGLGREPAFANEGGTRLAFWYGRHATD
jgi:hypothetical protein